MCKGKKPKQVVIPAAPPPPPAPEQTPSGIKQNTAATVNDADVKKAGKGKRSLTIQALFNLPEDIGVNTQ